MLRPKSGFGLHRPFPTKCGVTLKRVPDWVTDVHRVMPYPKYWGLHHRHDVYLVSEVQQSHFLPHFAFSARLEIRYSTANPQKIARDIIILVNKNGSFDVKVRFAR